MEPSDQDKPSNEELLDQLVEEYLAAIQKPEAEPSLIRERMLAEHPDVARQLESRLRILDIVRKSSDVGRRPATEPTFIGESVRAVSCPNCGCDFRVLSAKAIEATCSSCGSVVSFETDRAPSTRLEAPARIGIYRVAGLIGQGGFGAAYRAIDERLGRVVAIKIPRPGRFLGAIERERFIREAKAAAQLRHPGIVQVHEISTTGDQPFIVSDYIEGPNLSELILRQRLEFTEAVRIIAAVADAVEFAHSAGIVHRDLKPSNILLDFNRNPFVTDFGLARSRDAELTVTEEGDILGTPAYMSPEQAAGHVSRIDARSDVYSLGVVLYRLICGELPFRGSQQMQLIQAIQIDPQTPRSIDHRIPIDLETIALKAMSKEPLQRYQSAAELAADLRRWQKDEPVKARRIGKIGRLLRWRRRHPQIANLLATVISLLIVISVISATWAFREQHLTKLAEANELRALDSEAFSQQRLADLHTQNGLTAMTAGQLATAMLWFVQGMDDLTDTDHANRLRTAMCFEQLPTLTSAVSVPDLPLATAPQNPNDHFLIGTVSGNVHLANLTTSMEAQRVWKHAAPVSQLLVSQDLLTAAVILRGGTAVIRELQSGNIIQTITHEPLIADADLSPDSRLLATAGDDGLVRVTEAATGMTVAEFSSALPRASFARFVSNNRLVAIWRDVSATESVLQFLSVGDELTPKAENGAEAAAPQEYKIAGRVTFASLSADRNTLVVNAGSRVHVINVQSAAAIVEFDVGSFAARSYTTATQQIVTATGGGNLLVRSITGDMLQSVRFPWPVAGAVLDTTRTLLAVAGTSGQVAVYAADNLRRLTPYFGGSQSVRSIVFAADGRRIVMTTADGLVRMWDLAGAAPRGPVVHLEAAVRVARFSPSGRMFATATDDGTAAIWDSFSGELAVPKFKHEAVISDCAFSFDGLHLATACVDGTSTIFDLTGRIVGGVLTHDHPVQSLAFSPTENLLVTGSVGGEVYGRRVGSNEPEFSLTHTARINALKFSPDGEQFAAAAADGQVLVWTRLGLIASVPMVHPRPVLKVEWSSDSKFLATVSEDRKIRVFDIGANTAAPVHEIEASLRPMSVLFRPGDEFVTAGGTFVEAWQRHQRLWNFEASGFDFFHVTASSAAGLVAASGARLRSEEDSGQPNGGAFLLDGNSGLPVAPLLAHSSQVRRVFFSPDAKRLLTGSFDGTARVWSIRADGRSLSDIRRDAEILSGRKLSPGFQLESVPPDQYITLLSEARAARPDSFRVTVEQIASFEENLRPSRPVTTNTNEDEAPGD